jgi:cytochrome c-type biogenesis protein CcmH
MIWIGLAVLSVVAMLPLAIAIELEPVALGTRQAALTFHRNQLFEVEQNLGTGEVSATEKENVVADAQRRLLASADEVEVTLKDGRRAPLLVALVVVPAIALGLYLTNGSPDLPSVAGGAVLAEPTLPPSAEGTRLSELRLRARSLPEDSADARSAYIALGRAEAERGDMRAAAAAWNTALGISFEPTLAAATAEALSESEGHVDARAKALFERALENAPSNAPWRSMVVKRLTEAGAGLTLEDQPTAAPN